MAKNRYFQTTKGFNAEVIVANAVAYTTQESIADFAANAAQGEIGVYDAATDALLNGGTTLSIPDAPNAVVSLTGGSFAAGAYFWKIVAGNGAGVTTGGAEVTLTLTGSTSSVAFDWPAVEGATFYRVYRGPTGAEDHYQQTSTNSFTDTGAAGTAAALPGSNTATVAAAVPTGTIVYIAQMRDSLIHRTSPFTFSNAPNIATRTAYVAAVADVWSITGFPTAAAGQTYSIALFDTSTGSQPYQAYDYSYTLVTGDTIATALAFLAASINSTTNPVNIPFGPLATASVTGGNTLVLTGILANQSPFRIACREDAQYVTVTHTTPYNAGIGTYANVAQLEAEGIVFDGVTTNYPSPTNALPAEFGTPSAFAVSSLGYNIYCFNFWQDERSPLPIERHFQKKFIVLALPSTGTTPDAAIKAIFGQ